MIRTKTAHLFLAFILSISTIYCNKKPSTPDVTPPPVVPPVTPPVPPKPEYKTQNVIVVVVDGARYAETWGDSLHRFIPKRYALLSKGVLCDAMYNNGTTATVPGHTAIVTGFYQFIANDGTATPEKPSFFQHWLQKSKEDSTKAWVIAAKDKLEVLSDCVQADWAGKFRPSRDCGIDGLGTGYRNDNVTFDHAKTILSTDHPRLVLINFKQPDAAGHAADSAAYLKGIINTDNYVDLLWTQLQSDNFYKDKTTLIVANDHGRHTAGYKDGFVAHGDSCDGCKHIEFFAIGPDFKTNYISTTAHDQIDIAATVAALMKIEMPFSNGKVISDIFKN